MLSIHSAACPMLIAHRGYRAAYPENTLAAFRAAMNAGARMIELDVSLSKDRELIVIHDDSLDRTTDGRGRICDSGLAEIKKLDAGSWFSPSFAGERVPTLGEVLDMAAGQVLVNIEIKPEAFENKAPPDAIEKQVMSLVRKYNAKHSVLISSFELRILERFSDFPDPPALGVLTEKVNAKEILPFCKKIRAFSWNPDYPVLDSEQVSMMQQAGYRVFPYTVNDREEIKKLLDMGVDGFFTDEVGFDDFLKSLCQKTV